MRRPDMPNLAEATEQSPEEQPPMARQAPMAEAPEAAVPAARAAAAPGDPEVRALLPEATTAVAVAVRHTGADPVWLHAGLKTS